MQDEGKDLCPAHYPGAGAVEVGRVVQDPHLSAPPNPSELASTLVRSGLKPQGIKRMTSGRAAASASLAPVFSPGDARVDGGRQAGAFAERLADQLLADGRRCVRPRTGGGGSERNPQRVMLAVGSGWHARPPAGGLEVAVQLRTHRGSGGEDNADPYDPSWPVIRHVAPHLAGRGELVHRGEPGSSASRGATWDAEFGDDMPAYAAAVAIPAGSNVVDVGCGTGRALPVTRRLSTGSARERGRWSAA